ncbi:MULTISPECIES: T9SS type B sorting domain-containing protein [Mesonia]|uniref:Uncharacterized protein n=1 Tax=Mesonia oceanica TaxID=2687242 RepID=A0AC61Y5Y5_9FLAO|nr:MULTISPECIES: T9SS type B sorting domain-containing protein [Mesonia]MAN27216.1 hypothetical protein [Mesonia sp.]MAQ42388.1 hypothetical protein [Mesonia sp.]MBJ98676.1 hypothetical protein [Flavobacteriaceae bacterium]VVU99906.1 hypothetical protein FVB9532_01167 [Mesonia oceanica]|tara:strand:- start:124544 stop:127396 length:2853 start_codon:yes stop_codon:yes gene_type:complete
MKIILLILLLLPFSVFCQGEANYWFFGENAGVNFNTSPPTAITNGQLETNEGCSSISDENGNLLFYTDGRTIWNRNHQVMSNANYFGGTGLLGDPSSTSSGLIVPHPTDSNIYYVFTVDEPHHDNASSYPNQGPGTFNGQYSDLPGSGVPQDDDGYNNGLNYSVVDMTLDNGLGNVIPSEKNVHLITYDPSDSEEIKYKCSEKITAVKGSDCNSIWVLTHFIDKFYAFQIDNAGVNLAPVISQTGPIIPVSSYRRGAIGYMKISPNGKKLIIAHNCKSYNPASSFDPQDGGVYLYDFDDSTGQVSNNLPLVENVTPYGVEFSEETKKAYATATQGDTSFLYQWDLEATDIPASISSINGLSDNTATALQLAPNGKIYKSVISTSKLGVINNPELDADQVNYSESISNGGIYLQGRTAIFGLPPFIQSIFSSRINIIDENAENMMTKLDLCEDESFTLAYTQNLNSNNTYTWYKNGDIINGENTEQLTIATNPSNNFPLSDTYKLSIDLNDGSCPLIGIANVTFHPKPQPLDISLTQCSYFDNNTSIFNLQEAKTAITSATNSTIEFYETLSEAENSIDPIENEENFQNTENPQTIIARVNSEYCFSYAQVELNVSQNSNLAAIDLTECPTNENGFENFNLNEVKNELLSINSNFVISFYENEEDAILENNEINNITSFQNTNAFQQTIFARVDNDNLCEEVVAINLLVLNSIPIENEEEVIYCLENLPEPITLESGIPNNQQNNYTYYWEPSQEISESIETNDIVTHKVTVTNKISGCSKTKTINIIASNKAKFDVDIDGISNTNTVTIHLKEESLGDYVYSVDNQFSTYQEENIFQNLKPGTHIIYVKDLLGCGISSKEFDVLEIMKFFTPNQDGINDTWHLLGRNNENMKNAEIFIFNRFGKLITSLSPNGKGWDGTFNGKQMPANDYWYSLKLNNGKTYKGNFTLKR